MEVSRIHGERSGSSLAAMNGVDVSNVSLEDLPAYQERSDGPLISPVGPIAAVPAAQREGQRDSGVGIEGDGQQAKPTNLPDEPPPGYEEAQIQGLQDEMDRRLSEGGGDE